jgi:succinyl-diaminopimelate desuccinylase
MRRFCLGLLVVTSLLSVGLAQGARAQSERVRSIYRQKYSSRLIPLLTEALRFPTFQGNDSARDQQQAWLAKVGAGLGLTVRNAGLMTEVDLPGPENAPVLGLVVHGDVQPVNAAEWTFPPFSGVEKNGIVYGRGAADDKGPLVQALLTMAALRDSGIHRTHTIRLLVGSDEESTNLDITSYLKDHKAPNLSLVLDSGFPVVVGEKAWTAFTASAPYAYAMKPASANQAGFAITRLDAGLAASIVPSRADATLQWHGDETELESTMHRIQNYAKPAGYRLEVKRNGSTVVVTAFGRSAHAGVNIEGGRNALVFLARVLDGHLLKNGAADLLRYAGECGRDIYGGGLGLTTNDPLWGHYAVNVATIKADEKDPNSLVLTTNIRALPAMYGQPLRAHLEKHLAKFNAAHDEQFTAGGFYDDAPLAFDPQSKIVKRLMASYTRATGEHVPPAISGGGTYAKRLPNAIAFGMWFPAKPYPGHDVNEQITVKDLNRGVDVLIEALTDLETSEPIVDPFKR